MDKFSQQKAKKKNIRPTRVLREKKKNAFLRLQCRISMMTMTNKDMRLDAVLQREREKSISSSSDQQGTIEWRRQRHETPMIFQPNTIEKETKQQAISLWSRERLREVVCSWNGHDVPIQCIQTSAVRRRNDLRRQEWVYHWVNAVEQSIQHSFESFPNPCQRDINDGSFNKPSYQGRL